MFGGGSIQEYDIYSIRSMRRNPVIADLFQNIFAYIVCLCIYQIGSFVTGGSFGVGTVFGFVFTAIILFLLFRPDPYKDQKVYSKRSVQAAD